jgi:hypothetical protein
MRCRTHVHAALIAVLVAILVPDTAPAQTANRGEISASTSLSIVETFSTDLDGGGDFHWGTVIVSGTVSRQVTPQLAAGITLRYDYENWKFGSPVAFGGQAPWGKINAPNLAINFNYAVTSDLSLGVTPTFGWNYETGSADNSNAMVYGAIVSATNVFSPALVLGIGAGIVHQIDETKVFPFLIVRWQINERWLLANPFRAGPAGGAGLELAYTIDDDWETAGGGAYRSYRFKLREDGPTPNGVGENRFIPVFARVTRKLGKQSKLDFYAGISVGGRLSVDSSTGSTVARDDYKTAPTIGVTLAHRY